MLLTDSIDEVAHLHVRELEQVLTLVHRRHLLAHRVAPQPLQLVYHLVLLLKVQLLEQGHVDGVVLEQGRVLVEKKLCQVERFINVVKLVLINGRLKFGGLDLRFRLILLYLVRRIFLDRLIISLQLLNQSLFDDIMQ